MNANAKRGPLRPEVKEWLVNRREVLSKELAQISELLSRETPRSPTLVGLPMFDLHSSEKTTR